MVGGYTGKMLVIDLNTKITKVEKTNLDDARNFIGAKGLGAKYLFDNLPNKTDPLSPENILIFITGPLTGTNAQTSGRGVVVTKSPLTGLFVDSHFGGVFACEMKKAGWDLIVIKNSSKNHVYLVIKDEKVEFKEDDMAFATEMLVKFAQKGFKMIEVPSTYKSRKYGKTKLRKFQSGIKIFTTMVRGFIE